MSTRRWVGVPATLAKRLMAGDKESLGELARWAYDGSPSGLRDDILQGVLLSVAEMLHSDAGRKRLARIRDLFGFLSTIARRKMVDEFRRAKHAPLRLGSAGRGVAPDARDPATSTIHAEIRAMVRESLGRLEPLERVTLLRVHVLRQSYAVVAADMFGGAGSRQKKKVFVLLKRARSKLSRWLAGVDPR